MTNRTASLRKWGLMTAAALWALGLGAGAWMMLRHEFESSPMRPAPERVPPAIAALLPPAPPMLTIIAALHPDCPCTRASIEQLERLLAARPDAMRVIALFATSETEPYPDLRKSDYWRKIASLPRTVAVADRGGELAALLGAEVSGSVFAYDREGRLQFQGGVTASRGHSGSSRGLSQLLTVADAGTVPELCGTPVFGCSLRDATIN